MNAVEGQIFIDWRPGSPGHDAVVIESTRPLQASRSMLGKTPGEVVKLIPLLYSVCGIAQTRASLQALSMVSDQPQAADVETGRDALVLAETLREHLLRILMDWPALFGQPVSPDELSVVSAFPRQVAGALFKDGQAFDFDSQLTPDHGELKRLGDKIGDILQQQVFAMPADEWLGLAGLDELQRWAQRAPGIAALSIRIVLQNGWAQQGSELCAPLPELDNEALLKMFDTDDADRFIAQPQWQGQCHESTPLSRQLGQPLIASCQQHFQNRLLTRWLARLVELASLPGRIGQLLNQLDSDSNSTNSEQPIAGLAAVEAARGRLIHRCTLRDGRVSQYQILAPTEWNFHPQGLLAQSLRHIDVAADQRETVARLLINAIDPCVGYKLRVQS
jgi:hypothetical protein